jgi:hypothetical protein
VPIFVRRLLLGLLLGLLLAVVLAASRSEAIPPGDLPVGHPHQVVLVTSDIVPAGAMQLAALGDGYLSPVSAAPSPFTHLLLRWEATHPPEATLELALRASLDGLEWTDWGSVVENHDLWMPEDGDEVFWSQELYAGEGMQFWQLRVQVAPAPDGRLPELRRVELNSVDARFGPTDPAAALDEPTIGLASLGRPPVVSRTAWGSPDGQGSRATPAYHPVRHMVVHHTADANSLRAGQVWADRVRAIWSFHTITRGWGDIGYNYLIDPNGVVYEGRAGGDDAVGFHDTANYGSLGVALIGTYSSVEPPPAAFDSLVSLLAWKAAQKDIDPFGRSFYQGCAHSSFCSSFNPGAIVENIAGHRHVTPERTSCPGDRLASRLPELRQRVYERLSGAPPPPALPPAGLELLDVRYDRQSLAAGDLLKVVFTVRNSGTVPIVGQAPEAAPLGLLATNLAVEESHVYDEGECFLGEPAFPKEAGRFRVMLGPTDPTPQPVCPGETGGYPWRWGISGSLDPGATRDLVAYIRLRNPGSFSLRAGAIHEYVDYMARDVGAVTITVSDERQMPAPVAYDEQLRPLAHVYRLGQVPVGLLERTTDPTAAARGAYLGSFAWAGEELHWGLGGPLPEADDYFIVEQTRSFEAPVAGLYTFRLISDDGAWLWVNGQLVISHPGRHDATPVMGAIQLEAGRHVLAFKMFELTGGASVGYSVRMPGQEHFISPRDALALDAVDHLGARARALPTLSIAADDMGGTGVTQLRLSLNDGPWQTFSGPLATIGGLGPGPHNLRYMAVDQAGNESEQRLISLMIDPAMVVYRTYLPLAGR